MRRATALLLVIILSLALAGCAGNRLQSRTVPEKVTLAMGFIPNVQFTPVYVALEKGYFRDEGIEVRLDYGMETDLLSRVGTNELQFAIASGDQVVLARGGGLPVVYVLNWYQSFPVCVVSMASKGISEPADLQGHTVGTPVTEGASYIGWLAFLREAGLDADEIDMQVIGYTQVASLVEDRVDAAVCYAMNEPVQLRNAGYDVDVFYLNAYTSLTSNGLITNEETIERDPELVQAMVRAFLKGMRDTMEDPDAAFEIARASIPEMDDETAQLQRAVLGECLRFWQGEPLGANDPEAWDETVTLLSELGLTSGDIDPTHLYTNRFVDGA